MVTFNKVGPDWVYASTLAYGTRYTDSLLVTVRNFTYRFIEVTNAPSGKGLVASPAYNDATVYLQPCGAIYWYNSTNAALDVTFSPADNAAQCEPGDTTTAVSIRNMEPGTIAMRKFAGSASIRWIMARTSAPADSLMAGTVVTK
jgi:hypothetical protein